MTNEEKQIKIAECVDPVQYRPGTGAVIKGEPIWLNDRKSPITCPDYFGDLNAIHKEEKILTYEQSQKYVALIQSNYGDGYYTASVLAPAEQRAEAFGKTLNLW